jgi:hypothetical protein
MDCVDTQSLHALSDAEISRLVSIALEEFGKELTRTRFNDVMLALLEHLAGLEALPVKRRQHYRVTDRLTDVDRQDCECVRLNNLFLPRLTF